MASDEGDDGPLVLRDRDLSGSRFQSVNLIGAQFDDIAGSAISMSNADLSGLRARDLKLAGARIENADMSGVALVDVDVTGMTINGIPVSDFLEGGDDG